MTERVVVFFNKKGCLTGFGTDRHKKGRTKK
jgi:hypothetical protein